MMLPLEGLMKEFFVEMGAFVSFFQSFKKSYFVRFQNDRKFYLFRSFFSLNDRLVKSFADK